MIGAIWRKLFYSPYFFTIAIRHKSGKNVLEENTFRADYTLPATCARWAADPVLVDWEDKTYLFYESVLNQKGRIEVAQVNPDCSLSQPEVLLEDECHYSYPFVFCRKGEWYMIPESSAAQEVRLYKSHDFPRDWRPVQILLRERAVDTTAFVKDGQMYLLTFLLTSGTEAVIPRAYRMNWNEDVAQLSHVDWNTFDTLAVRGAGGVISWNNELYRPAQKSLEQRYGDAVLFYKIEGISNEYSESLVTILKPESVENVKIWMDGLHTYTQSEYFQAIDVRCRRFDFWKIGKALVSKRNGLRKQRK